MGKNTHLTNSFVLSIQWTLCVLQCWPCPGRILMGMSACLIGLNLLNSLPPQSITFGNLSIVWQAWNRPTFHLEPAIEISQSNAFVLIFSSRSKDLRNCRRYFPLKSSFMTLLNSFQDHPVKISEIFFLHWHKIPPNFFVVSGCRSRLSVRSFSWLSDSVSISSPPYLRFSIFFLV